MTRRRFIVISLAASSVPLIGYSQTTVTFSIPTKKAPAFDRPLLLRCIAEIESGNDDSKIGRFGERSKYQITYAVWLQHAEPMIRGIQSFRKYCNAIVADALATEHLDWIIKQVGSNPFAIVASWHLGVDGSKRRWSAHASDHINRTVRLYRERAG